jgi:serine/threonine protein kinase
VFEATDRQLDRRVAVKLLHEDLNDAHAQDRFLREARSAAAITHPNACRLYEVGDHEGQVFLVMELLDGELLSARIARGPLPPAEAIGIMLPLMSAVAALHQAGLIHRDLKPSNVFLTADGVKLLDFGLARHTRIDAAFTAPSLTLAGAVSGTLRYMAPEQVTGDAPDERTDVFALGVMLYEMLTGRNPFNAETNVDWLNAVLREDPQPMGRPELLPLEPVVWRALERRQSQRFASVREMAAVLQTAAGLDAAPTTAGASTAREDGRETIVVLPFRGLQDDPDVAFLQHGVPEGLTAALSTDAARRVLSNREALRFDGTADLITIGRELRADVLLTGTFLRAGQQVRVSTQLVAAADGTVQWSHTSQHAFEDALTLQDDICHRLLQHLPPAGHAAVAAVAVAVPG